MALMGRRPHRDDYAVCDCTRAQEEGTSICAGCEEWDAAMRKWLEWNDPACVGEELNDEYKDERR